MKKVKNKRIVLGAYYAIVNIPYEILEYHLQTFEPQPCKVKGLLQKSVKHLIT